jgi:hypothetical protein
MYRVSYNPNPTFLFSYVALNGKLMIVCGELKRIQLWLWCISGYIFLGQQKKTVKIWMG